MFSGTINTLIFRVNTNYSKTQRLSFGIDCPKCEKMYHGPGGPDEGTFDLSAVYSIIEIGNNELKRSLRDT